jgi:Undecaprenyl-phosphate galactose phosphotransferase WbaP
MAATVQATAASLERVSTRPRPLLTSAILAATDVAALCIFGFIGMQVWMLVGNVPALYLRLWPALGIFLLMFALEGLYPGVGIGPVEEMRRLVRGTSLVYLGLIAIIFVAKGSNMQSRGEILSAWLLTIVMLPLARALVHHFIAQKPWYGVPAIVFGSGETAELLIEKLQLGPELAIKPLACIDDRIDDPGGVSGVPLFGNPDMAGWFARTHRVRHALIAKPELKSEELAQLLEMCSLTFPHVYVIANMIGLASIPVCPIDVGGMFALELRHNLLFKVNRSLKRSLDLLMVLAVAPFTLPVILLAALAVFLVSRGNPFYWHEREGELGQPIHILKLRTMFPDAQKLLDDYLNRNEDARREWEQHCKLKHDPRVIPGIGSFLRRSSLDELPQLWNILIGDMSLVGPRPFPAYHNRQFPPAFRELRTRVRPGLTGLWQISARSEANIEAQEVLDTYYIRNWSLWLDIYVLSRTVQAVISGRGAY